MRTVKPVHRLTQFSSGLLVCGGARKPWDKVTMRNSKITCPACIARKEAYQARAKARFQGLGGT